MLTFALELYLQQTSLPHLFSNMAIPIDYIQIKNMIREYKNNI